MPPQEWLEAVRYSSLLTMQQDLQRVLELQPFWDSTPTAAMSERGHLIRHAIPIALRTHTDVIASATGVAPEGLLIEGRDGTGPKSRIPWVRFASRNRSPRATDGFYVVLLWAFDASAVYLSINQGTTDLVDGSLVRKPADVLAARVQWGRAVLKDWISSRPNLVPVKLHDVGETSLGRGYELGNIAAVQYSINAIPPDEAIFADILDFAGALNALYTAHSNAPLPDELPEVAIAQEVAEVAAGKFPPPRGVGFRQNAAERTAIEMRAIDMAIKHFEDQGWSVTKKGAPYDLDVRKGDQHLTVEVKGTTSSGGAVVLTNGEVLHQRMAYPHNALIVVRGILLDRSTDPPSARGGILVELRPWSILDRDLTVISYQYAVPGDGQPSEQ